MRGLILVVALSVLASAGAVNLYPFLKPQFSSGDIIDGDIAQPGEAPYIVSLKTSSHFCAGTIIDAHWVMSAAHCLTSSSFSVVAGLHKRTDESEAQIRQVKKASQIITHASYTGGVGPYDIGLIYVDVPFDFTAKNRAGKPLVGKVEFPSGSFVQPEQGVVYGWGRDRSNSLPIELNRLVTEIISYSDCKDRLPAGSPIQPSNVCSHKVGSPQSACNGDSGGPLVLKSAGGDIQVGIVSWGYSPCASNTYPSVYTHTEPYKSWIEEKKRTYVPS